MAVSRYNREGYFDPVVYEALTNVELEERAVRMAAEIKKAERQKKVIRYFTDDCKEKGVV